MAAASPFFYVCTSRSRNKRVDCCNLCEKMGMLRIRQIFILHTRIHPPDARTTAPAPHTAHRKNRRRLSKHASRHCTAWCAARAHALFGRSRLAERRYAARGPQQQQQQQPHRSNSVQGQHHDGSKVPENCQEHKYPKHFPRPLRFYQLNYGFSSPTTTIYARQKEII